MYLRWSLCTLYFACMPGENYRRRLRSLLLCLCDVFRALVNSFVDNRLKTSIKRKKGTARNNRKMKCTTDNTAASYTYHLPTVRSQLLNLNQKPEGLLEFQNKTQTQKRFKRTLFIRRKRSMRIFVVSLRFTVV